ncbi:MAG TPA: WD40 repeat domain-containing protein [Actinoplanes sp.]|nr:WD40 repeat domain-containing protein [Actinoplanes sp.]
MSESDSLIGGVPYGRQRAAPRPAGAAVFRSDGRRLASIGPDGELRLWDTTWPRRTSVVTRLRRRRRVLAAAWNPRAANLLAAVSVGGGLAVWRLLDDRPLQLVWAADQSLAAADGVAWLDDGRHLVCTTRYGEARVWDTGTGVCRSRVPGRREACLAMTTGPGDVLTLAFRDGLVTTIRLRENGVRPAAGRVPPIAAAAWSPSGALLGVAAVGGAVGLLDRRLRLICAADVSVGAPPVLGWAGESLLVVADHAAGALTAVETSGRIRWRTPVARRLTTLSAGGELIALGGGSIVPLIVDAGTGEPLFPD